MQLASAPRESSDQNERASMAVQAAPAPAGDSHWCHGFCQRDNKQLTSLPCIAPRVQKHAPPRLCANCTYRRTLAAIHCRTASL